MSKAAVGSTADRELMIWSMMMSSPSALATGMWTSGDEADG